MDFLCNKKLLFAGYFWGEIEESTERESGVNDYTDKDRAVC